MSTEAAHAEEELGPLPGFLRPLVDRVARIKATVHAKLLAGFLIIAVLLLAMGGLSVAVLNRVNHQVDTLTALNRQTDLAREMIYKVTVQMHYRAMALVTDRDPGGGRVRRQAPGREGRVPERPRGASGRSPSPIGARVLRRPGGDQRDVRHVERPGHRALRRGRHRARSGRCTSRKEHPISHRSRTPSTA